MKIICLQAENVKRLVAVEIKPDGNIVQITGKNGAGKTSVLDALWWGLSGATHIQAAPIRNGATKARIRLDLGELVVTRTFNRKKDDDAKVTTSITVESTDGAVFRSPQKVLDELLGELSFDPLAFTRMKPAEQIDTMRRFVPGVDFDEIERQNQADYDKRRDINRRAKELRARLATLTVPDVQHTERVDESALVNELEQAGEHNAQIEARKARREKLEDQARQLGQSAEQEKAKAEDLRRRAQELLEQATVAEGTAKAQLEEANAMTQRLAEAGALPEPLDTTLIRQKITASREANRSIDERERIIAERKQVEADAEAAEKQSDALTAAMHERDAAKAKAISESELPVPGLSFDATGVTLDGVPFDQASDAEQLRASVAIASAMNPKLRVIRIRDGSLLDDDGMTLLAQMADEQDMQVWVEKVDSSGKVGFVISDGELVAAKAEDAA